MEKLKILTVLEVLFKGCVGGTELKEVRCSQNRIDLWELLFPLSLVSR